MSPYQTQISSQATPHLKPRDKLTTFPSFKLTQPFTLATPRHDPYTSFLHQLRLRYCSFNEEITWKLRSKWYISMSSSWKGFIGVTSFWELNLVKMKTFLYCSDGRKPLQTFLWCYSIQAHWFLHELDIPHSDKRFVEFNKDGKQLDVDVHRKNVSSGPATAYMASLMKDSELNLFINPQNVWDISLLLKRT